MNVVDVDPLLSAIQAQEPNCWADAYIEHREVMFSAAMRVLNDRHDAADAIQEALCSLMTSSSKPKENLRAYMAEAARNKARDLVRKNARSRTAATGLATDLEPDLDPHDDDRVPHQRVRTQPAPTEEAAIASIALDQALILLHQLPERIRYALKQRWLRGRPAKDVAAELRVSPQRIAQLVNDGLGLLEELSPFITHHESDPLSRSATGSTKDTT